jgi:hypothetical protein
VQKKYEWARLKRKFVVGKCKTLKAFAEREKIPYELLKKHSKEWIAEKRTELERNEYQIRGKILAAQVEKEVDRNTRVLNITDKFLDALGKAKLSARNAKAFGALAKALESLQKVHRTGEGLDKERPPENALDALKELNFKVSEVATEHDD